MSKQDTNSLRANATTANQQAAGYGANAQSTYSALTPTLNKLAAGGGGYTPTQMAGMNTAALDATGGANAGTVGGALQRAAATNNAGGANAVGIAAAHDATSQLSDAALGVQNQSAMLAAQQQQGALAEQGQIYGTSAGAQNQSLGLSNQATNAAEQASQNGVIRNSFVSPLLRGFAGNLISPGAS